MSFDNTEIAFSHKSDAELKKAYRLFQTFSYPLLVKYGPKLANLALSIGLPVKRLIKSTLFAQFCGGETIQECSPSAKELYKSGIGAILDYSVEGEGKEEDFVKTFEELKKVILEAANKDEYPIAVFKCTGICKFSMLEARSIQIENSEEWYGNESYEAFEERFAALCELAHSKNVKLYIDAEETWIQAAIDEIAYKYMSKYNTSTAIVFNTIQLYRKGRIEEIKKQVELGNKHGYHIAFKLVRGAYMEKEATRAEELGYTNPIQDNKADTDRDYNDALEFCFEHRKCVHICAGTHNEESSILLAELIVKSGVHQSDDRFWFGQLYGMSDHISYNLAKQGFNVVKYLPYGPIKEVLPYLSRRAQENSSVKGQASRELSLIKAEIKRRNLAN